MKKLLSIIIAAVMLCSVAGCSSGNSSSETAPSTTEKAEMHYKLDKPFNFYDIRVDIDSTWGEWDIYDKVNELVPNFKTIAYKIPNTTVKVSFERTLIALREDRLFENENQKIISREPYVGARGADSEIVSIHFRNNKETDYSSCYIMALIDTDKYCYIITVSADIEYKYDCYNLIRDIADTVETDAPTVEDETEIDETEEPTQEPTEPPTEKQTIINNTSSGGFQAEGNGDYVAKGLHVTGCAVLHIEHTGDGHFAVTSYEGADGDDYDSLLANTTGNYSGDVLIDHSGDFVLEIKANGHWKITSSGLQVDDTTSFSGHGDAVTGLTTHSGGAWAVTHNGTGHFSITEYGLDDGYLDLLVNTTGAYSGVVKAEKSDYPVFFEVSADGDWTIKKE